MKKRITSICLGMLCFTLLYQLGCGVVIPFRGPTDHPKFEDMDWQELTVKYWVVKDTTNANNWREDEKSLKLTGKELDALKKVFETASSKGTAQGSVRPWILSTNKGDWYFELASPNTAFLCNVDNTDRAYYVELNSIDFYEKLKKTCVEKEKNELPSIQFDNIRICRRFGGSQGPQEKIVPLYKPENQEPIDVQPEK